MKSRVQTWKKYVAHYAIPHRFCVLLVLAALVSAASQADATTTSPCCPTTPQSLGTTPIEVCVSRAALVQANSANGEIVDVQIADEQICLRVLRPARGMTFEIMGVAEGTTTATVWQKNTGADPTPTIVKVHVTYPCDEFESLAQAINADLDPPPLVPITITRVPVSGKILVKGRVQHCAQVEQIRKLIGGAAIQEERLVYQVTFVSRPCCCTRCWHFRR
jgi:Flp pilus assembly secretin CpaC